MPRSTVVLCAAAPLLGACAGNQRAHLDAHGIALPQATAEAVAVRSAAPSSVADAAAGPSPTGPAPAADHQLEVQLRRELQEKLAGGGSSALELIEPGASIESRLRFAISRMVLGRGDEAATALVALTADVPSCALAWTLLGQVRAESGETDAAVACLRRARQLWLAHRLPPHPALNYRLGRALLQTEHGEEGMRLLREELATGSNRAAAAELLARVHGDRGDFETALACVDAVLDDAPDEPGLVLTKVELLADQLRVDEALAELRQHGGKVAPPVRLYRLAQLEHQRGRMDTALAHMDTILAEHADHPLVKASLPSLHAARAEIDNDRAAGVRRHKRERELLGQLRFAEQPAVRARAARALAGSGRVDMVPIVVRWALRDPHEAVRIAVLQACLARCENPGALIVTGLGDAAASVRAAAAVEAARLPQDQVFAALVDALEREDDADAFRTLHRALTAVTGRNITMPFDGERHADNRRRVGAAWRAELEAWNKARNGS